MPAELLDRDDEMATVERLIDAAVMGLGGTLILTGPAGIGKSTVLAAARARATSRRILGRFARAAEREAEFPCGVARQLLAGDAAERWSVAAFDASASVDADPDGVRRRLIEDGVGALTQVAAGGPVVAVVDDVH